MRHVLPALAILSACAPTTTELPEVFDTSELTEHAACADTTFHMWMAV
ncbi:MAG: hypothetical protein ACJATT_003783 [Myxococcota bacterium]|jgi:hypothetical protein